ncbi:aromatic ring-hydroxylating dioxygenase subunit alpha [bacterium]|nr:aromatic ring-hydroxylating dioxygenase subunit alpha [bacterium]
MYELIKNQWYAAVSSKDLKPEQMLSLEIMGDPVLFFRKSTGEVSAIRDICPHRGIPFKHGRLVHDMVECPYHGWKFDGGGVCREIPSLTETQKEKLDCTKIKVKSYQVQERYGCIWAFIGDADFDQTKCPQPPVLGDMPLNAKPNMIQVETFDCHIDHAVIGLMDPAHGAYVHKSRLWRNEKSTYEKHKAFGPVDYGFQMKRHQPSANSKAYKIFGGQPTTEITFRIPGNRVEHIQIGSRYFFTATGLMPINEKKTQIIQLSYWNMPWLSLLKPFIAAFADNFLWQDIDAVTKQQEGLKYDPNLMLINDADTQAKWYYSLKKEWFESSEQKREFNNPVKDVTLSWKS